MKDFNVDDIVKYTGKSLQNITNGSEYTIIKKWNEKGYYRFSINHYVVAYLDDSRNEKYIHLTDNEWRKKFVLVCSGRKRKLEKLRYGSDM
jgi:hypothetical protein